MRELTIKLPDKSYPILIKKGLFERAGEFIQKLFADCKVFIVTDSNVASVYGDKLVKQLDKAGVVSYLYVFPAGESSKCHNELLKIYEALGKAGITRKDTVVALGGGVTGDLTGFAASTWLRGTGFLQIPTTLLAMIDSSIGGKVAVDLPAGKNLVGSFYHPKAVLIDPLLLNTLPDRVFADGMAEVVKHGCIRDEGLFSELEQMKSRSQIMSLIDNIILRNCDIKRQIVEQDERESGLRMILNFGHTFGHVVEKAFQYKKYTHGEAVAVGMVFAAELSFKLGLCNEKTVERLKSLLQQFQLPIHWPVIDPEIAREAILVDKKAGTDHMNLVLIRDIGNVTIEKYSKDLVIKWLLEAL